MTTHTTTNYKEYSVREALNEAIKSEMKRDENVFIIGEEVGQYQGAYKVTQGLLSEFGVSRVIDTPISEYGFSGIGVGAAFAGLRPIVEFMTFNFAMQALDHIVNSAAKTLYMSGGALNCPIVFRGPNGVASMVGAQHSHNYASLYSNIPGLKVVAPYSAQDAYGLLISAIRDDNPVIFLENEILYGQKFETPIELLPVEIGKCNILRNGKDITLISFSIQLNYVLEAAKQLAEIGVDAEVIDIRTIKPLDKDTIISSVKKTNRVVIVEEGWFFSGVGASIAAIISYEAFDYLDAPVEVISAKDVPLAYARNLEKISVPSVDEIITASKRVCYI